MDLFVPECSIVMDSVALSDRPSACAHYDVSRLAEHVAFIQRKTGGRKRPARITRIGLGSRAGQTGTPGSIVQPVRMENQIQMVCAVNGAALLRLRGFCMYGAGAFSWEAGSSICIGSSKYTSGTANGAGV